jgi:uridine kinase
MKICFLICGLPRTIDLVISNIETLFVDHEVEINVSTSTTEDSNDEYINFNSNNIINNKKINKLLFVKNESDGSFRNSCNFMNKLYLGLSLFEKGFDMYIIIRSDLIFNNIHFLSNIVSDDLHFSNVIMNTFTKNNIHKLNEHVIISKNIDQIKKLSGIYDFCKEHTDYSDIILYNYLNNNLTNYELIEIQYKLILSKCNVFAISGDSGSGKTTMMNVLKQVFRDDKLLTLETDRYHKWERGDPNYNEYTHLNPYANQLELMAGDVYNLKIGNSIFQVDYDHKTGKFTEKQKIESKENIILCGLHTIYNESLNESIDLKIFMDTDRSLIKKWKIQRDVIERGYSMEKVLKQIEAREDDYVRYIKEQKNNADIIVHYYEDTDNELRCNLTIPNIEKFNKMKKDLTIFNYEIDTESNKIFINVEKTNFLFSNDLLFEKTKQTKCFDEILFIIKIFLHSM